MGLVNRLPPPRGEAASFTSGGGWTWHAGTVMNSFPACGTHPPTPTLPPKRGAGVGRPLGIPTVEDKVLQRAVATILATVYEQDFMNCSYGYRPGRSAHQALEALWQAAMGFGQWVLEGDIRKFFDTLDHKVLTEFLDRRLGDGVRPAAPAGRSAAGG